MGHNSSGCCLNVCFWTSCMHDGSIVPSWNSIGWILQRNSVTTSEVSCRRLWLLCCHWTCCRNQPSLEHITGEHILFKSRTCTVLWLWRYEQTWCVCANLVSVCTCACTTTIATQIYIQCTVWTDYVQYVKGIIHVMSILRYLVQLVLQFCGTEPGSEDTFETVWHMKFLLLLSFLSWSIFIGRG